MPDSHPSADLTQRSRRGDPPRGPVRWFLDLFSSVKLGITLLALLFVYMAVGSAGILYPIHPNLFHPDAWVHAQMRQWRPFEMTEFEWFHWWPFDLLIGLICLNIAVTTVRRIPFRPVNFGVWTIHVGILILAAGSLIYFGTKVEGDAPVLRRKIVISWNGAEEEPSSALEPDGTAPDEGALVLAAVPGNRGRLESDGGAYEIEVVDIDPQWELLSGLDAGERAYSVTLMVEGPDGGRFMRQVIAGRPEYTEDLLFTEDPSQPVKRAAKVNGDPIVDAGLNVELAYESQEWFYLAHQISKSWALYVRPAGAREWGERPVDGLPLYNDYIASRDWVFEAPNAAPVVIDPIDLEVPPGIDDPCPDLDLRITGYLRYAVERSRIREGGPAAAKNPTAFLTIASDLGERSEYRLQARNPDARRADGGLLAFEEIADERGFESLLTAPTLRFRVPELEFEVEEEVRAVMLAQQELAFSDLGETGYAYRVVAVQDDIALSSGEASIAIIEIRTPDARILRRWVFDDPRLTRDVGPDMTGPVHGGPALLDESIEVEYLPGTGMALLTLVLGPEPDRLRLISSIGAGPPTASPIDVGRPVRVEGGLEVVLDRFLPQAIVERKPWIVPPNQRDRDAGTHFAMVRVEGPGIDPQWLPFHQYAFDGPENLLRRFRFDPTTLTLADGRRVEVVFSRQRMPLPAEIALEEFILTAHVGGFTGESGSIRNWTSRIRFRTDEGWTDPRPISVNEPVAYGGYSYFQSQWDPPDPARESGDRASRGLNYTVLGVGNRHGIYTQLAGCTIAVFGMLYAFYVKPIIRRRQLDRAAAIAAAETRSQIGKTAAEPALAGGRS